MMMVTELHEGTQSITNKGGLGRERQMDRERERGKKSCNSIILVVPTEDNRHRSSVGLLHFVS